MYLFLIFLPLLGSLLAGFFGRFLGFRGAALITTFSVFTSFIMSVNAFYEVALSFCFYYDLIFKQNSLCYVKLSSWFVSEMFDSSWGFYFDTLTQVMLVVVTSVSTLVHLYSISYMSGDPHLPRFMQGLLKSKIRLRS